MNEMRLAKVSRNPEGADPERGDRQPTPPQFAAEFSPDRFAWPLRPGAADYPQDSDSRFSTGGRAVYRRLLHRAVSSGNFPHQCGNRLSSAARDLFEETTDTFGATATRCYLRPGTRVATRHRSRRKKPLAHRSKRNSQFRVTVQGRPQCKYAEDLISLRARLQAVMGSISRERSRFSCARREERIFC